MDATVHNRIDTGDNRSISSLLRELRDETALLLRQEVALAKTELSEKAARTGRNAAYLAAGGAVACAGAMLLLLAVTAAVAALLNTAGLEWEVWSWLAPLIVGGVVAVVGYGLLQKAISTLKSESPVPEKTTQSLQENKRWLQHKVS